MKIETFLNFITLAGVIFLISIILIPFVFHHPIDDCCHASPDDPNYHPIVTNATDSDPIFGHWVYPNKKYVPPVDIAFERDGYAQKTEHPDNFTFTNIRGPWTKISENYYFIQWVVELEMSGDYHVNGSFIPINETITYDPAMDKINVNGIFYSRKNVTIYDESLNYTNNSGLFSLR